ncbi:MAG: pyridoxine 5'-phosphate synthase [Kiritimatiellae bacterium]|nr:pyridoxine 5'-phosphate synthase [Kiritimatiellia bacterium]
MTEIGRLRLGVNVDHVATLRQARRTPYPSVIEAARICEAAGADFITVHLREDRRHIQDADVRDLKKILRARMNLEMATNPQILAIALEVRPDEACIVPERRQELTTEGGLDVASKNPQLLDTIRALDEAGVMVSLFVDPDPRQIAAASELGVKCIELHTGTFCDAARENRESEKSRVELDRLIEAARQAHAAGLRVNAGHGISLETIMDILQVPFLDTLNIGHSIIARALFVGLERAVTEMLQKMRLYTGGRHG